jgi:aminoglycoside 6'-N-acetyltransferase
VAVRPMTYGDLPDVVAWRAAPHVLRWWDADVPDLEAATARYGPRIDGASPISMWVWEVNGRSVGLVQDYRIADHPEYALLTPDPTAVGVDYLLGEADRVGRGLGTRCLWAWAVHARARYPDVGAFFAAPDHRNRASLRVLAKLGFAEGLWFDEPQEDGTVATVVGCTFDVGRVLGSDGDPP